MEKIKSNFKQFSGIEYLAIDIANSLGLDKLNYEDRIKHVCQNVFTYIDTETSNEDIVKLLDLINADEPELAFAGIKAYQHYLNHEPSGYRISLDSSNSGTQLGSVLTADITGLKFTGLIGDNREDAYTEILKIMQSKAGKQLNYTRKQCKSAMMTGLYGSKKVPESIFGKETATLELFYDAVKQVAHGAWELKELMVNCWSKGNDCYEWVMPDNFHVVTPVIVDNYYKVPHADTSVIIRVKEQGTSKSHYLANAANLIHSLDSLVLREVVSRCNYDLNHVAKVNSLLKQYGYVCAEVANNEILGTLVKLSKASGYVTSRFIDEIQSAQDLMYINAEIRDKLITMTDTMLKYKPFDISVIHDCYQVLPNNGNYLRYWYKEICADICESNMCLYLINQFPVGDTIQSDGISQEHRKYVANLIRNSVGYGLC